MYKERSLSQEVYRVVPTVPVHMTPDSWEVEPQCKNRVFKGMRVAEGLSEIREGAQPARLVHTGEGIGMTLTIFKVMKNKKKHPCI